MGERVREVELSSKWRREKERLLMEMAAPVEGRHRIWKEGWPQPSDNENGNGGGEVKGGHEILVLGGVGEQAWDDGTTVVKNVRRKMILAVETAAECGGGGGGGESMMVVEPKWEMPSSVRGRKI